MKKNENAHQPSQKASGPKKAIPIHKMTLSEKQTAKLKLQKERQALKKGNPPKNKDRFYCTSEEMQAELVKWRDSNLEEEKARLAKGLAIDYTKRKISEEFGRMLIAIADKMLNRSEFRNYSKQLKEDAKGYFFYKAIRGMKNYNFEFNNPFAYFSTCAWNAYITIIMKNYKHENFKRNLSQDLLTELETYHGIDSRSSLSNYIRQYLDSSSTIKNPKSKDE